MEKFHGRVHLNDFFYILHFSSISIGTSFADSDSHWRFLQDLSFLALEVLVRPIPFKINTYL